jgi:glycosyltransferase involved in cell wall biosynthesis
VGAYYERAAVVCVPSRREGYGFSAREAMAYGRPVVATRVGGLVDAIVDGESGLLVERDGLREAIVGLLENRELRARLGAMGRERARQTFSEAAAAGSLQQLYQRFLQREA